MERGKGLLGNIHYGAAFKYGKDVCCEKSGSGTVEKARKVIGDRRLRIFGAKAAAANPMTSKLIVVMQG